MLTFDGITRKVGSDTLTWLWPWRRKYYSDRPWRSELTTAQFFSVEEYKSWIGMQKWGLATLKICGFSLLDLVGGLVNQVRPTGSTVVLIGHSIDTVLEKRDLDKFLFAPKQEVIRDNDCLILAVKDSGDGVALVNAFREKEDGLAALYSDGKLMTTNSYLHRTKPYINPDKMVNVR